MHSRLSGEPVLSSLSRQKIQKPRQGGSPYPCRSPYEPLASGKASENPAEFAFEHTGFLSSVCIVHSPLSLHKMRLKTTIINIIGHFCHCLFELGVNLRSDWLRAGHSTAKTNSINDDHLPSGASRPAELSRGGSSSPASRRATAVSAEQPPAILTARARRGASGPLQPRRTGSRTRAWRGINHESAGRHRTGDASRWA